MSSSSFYCIHVFVYEFSSWVDLVGPSVGLDFVFYVTRLWVLDLSFGLFGICLYLMFFGYYKYQMAKKKKTIDVGYMWTTNLKRRISANPTNLFKIIFFTIFLSFTQILVIKTI